MPNVAITGVQPHDAHYLLPALASSGHTPLPCANLASPDDVASLPDSAVLVAFVGDDLSAPVLETLAARGVRLIALRAAGYDNVDIDAARALGLRVSRVPAYSPESVAEHAAALLLAAARQLPVSFARVRQGNFSLDGLLGFSLHGKTVGIIGMGRIGRAFARIAQGFGCRVLAASRSPFTCEGVTRVGLPELWQRADIVSLHCPLSPDTRHLVNAQVVSEMKPDGVLVNTARGGLVDTAAVLDALDAGTLRAYCADVYEREACVFFRDLSGCGYDDPLLKRLIQHPRVIVTPHQAFFTHEALRDIAASVVASIEAWQAGETTPDFLV